MFCTNCAVRQDLPTPPAPSTTMLCSRLYEAVSKAARELLMIHLGGPTSPDSSLRCLVNRRRQPFQLRCHSSSRACRNVRALSSNNSKSNSGSSRTKQQEGRGRPHSTRGVITSVLGGFGLCWGSVEDNQVRRSVTKGLSFLGSCCCR